MTEAEWGSCSDPGRMLDLLLTQRAGGPPLGLAPRGAWPPRSFERKLRLLACAACTWLCDLPCVRGATGTISGVLEAVERFADGLAGEEELQRAREWALAYASEQEEDSWCNTSYIDEQAMAGAAAGRLVASAAAPEVTGEARGIL